MKKEQKAAQFSTLPHAARRLGVSVSLARELVKDPNADFPPTFTLGRRRVVSSKQLDKWSAQKHGDAA